MELDADVARAVDLEERHRLLAVEVDLGVRGVVADDDLVTLGERDRLAEELARRGRRRRIVRVAEPHQLRGLRDAVGNRRQVGQERVLAPQRHAMDDAVAESRADRVDRITGVGAEHDVARIDERDRHVRDAFLRADQRDDLAIGVEADAESRCVPVRGGTPERRHAFVIRVAVVGGVARRLAKLGDDVRRCR